jgi:uridine kinase
VAGQVSRAALLAHLVELVASRYPERVLRVAVDGPDTAGKTTLADELASHLTGIRHVIRASIDGFHRPRDERYRRGHLSPEGAYHDTFDYHAVRSVLLDPLGPAGNRWYRTAVFDHRTDRPVDHAARLAPPQAVLLFDGVFLLRPPLRDCWDIAIFLDVSPDEILRRAILRDAKVMGGPEAVRERYLHRYLPAQQLYRDDAAPDTSADVALDNTNPAQPRVIRWPT